MNTNTKPYDLAIVIGRFQPFHNGHLDLFKHAATQANHCVVMLGSCKIARNTKNPFTGSERATMMKPVLNPLFTGIAFYDAEDNLYNDMAWAAQIQEFVARAMIEFGIKDSKRIVLVGHNKDESSWYLKLFKQWDYSEAKRTRNLDATNIRNRYFSQDYNWFKESNEVHEYSIVPKSVFSYLESFKNIVEYSVLCREHEHLVKYKKSWESAPYPPIFVTVDVVLTCGANILMVKRKSEPGKGLWALPGGFLNYNERIIPAMLRELREETQIAVSDEVLLSSLRGIRVFDAPGRSLRGRTITHCGRIELQGFSENPWVKGNDDAEVARFIEINEFRKMGEKTFDDHSSIGITMIDQPK